MNLQQLEYFKIIAETRNFTTASNILSVTQPALSKAISKLEEELDVSLFEKEGRNIKITKFGEEFFKYVDSALNEIERGKEKLKDMKKSNDRVISISSNHCIGSTFIPFLISNFINNKLQVKFNINNQSTEEILKDLQHGRVDFGFFDNIEEIEKYQEVEFKLVKKEEYVLIVPKNHHLANKEEINLSELKDEYFIVYKDKSCGEKITYSEFIDYTPKILAEPSEGGVLSGLVASGAGIAIVLNTPIMNTNKISVIKIKDNIGYKSIYMGWNKALYTSQIKKEFKEYTLSLVNV
ncbi:LysR family transcriptional regulator [Terrisporobacter sp.]|uniref:LysR family transcriptional regulator n=1 Tax=Terrisporobacter sp. TaxID=1965305 RepID=UPI00261AA240|nr:LysR family transcriptional regulator [Terrisporobacter sp.]